MPTRRVLAALVVALPHARGEWTGILGLNFESDGNKVDQRAMQCPSGFITGVSVRHGRDDDDDTDMYDFKLRCGDRWSAWSGMPFKKLKQEKSARACSRSSGRSTVSATVSNPWCSPWSMLD